MKILMLTWEYPPRVVGGIARVVYDLSHRLIKDGHEVTVVTYRDGETPYFEDDITRILPKDLNFKNLI